MQLWCLKDVYHFAIDAFLFALPVSVSIPGNQDSLFFIQLLSQKYLFILYLDFEGKVKHHLSGDFLGILICAFINRR